MRHLKGFPDILVMWVIAITATAGIWAYVQYEYPWEITRVHSFKLLTETPIVAGSTVRYQVCYTKFLPIPGEVMVTLRNSTVKTIKVAQSNSEVGVFDGKENPCAESYATIPKETTEDVDYTLGWQVQYTPTPLSKDKIYKASRTAAFEIVGAKKKVCK